MAKNPTIMLIDQDPTSRAEVHRMLALSGFAILGESGYGVEAISLAKETDPDVIVMALEEPIVRPLQTIEAVTDILPHIPIVVYSSLNDTAITRRAVRAGVRDFCIKPLNDQELTQAITTLLAQEERKRQRLTGQAEAIAAHGTIITVFGAKGGIGKTTISTNLATALAQKTEQSVVLADLDTRFGDVAIMMDIPAEHSIADLALPAEEIDRETVRHYLYQHPSGVMVLPAPPRPEQWRQLTPGHVEKVLLTLAGMFDYVVVDTPGAFNEIIAKALELSTIVLLITTVDMASLKDTLLTLDMMDAWAFPPEKVKVMLNHANVTNSVAREDVRRSLGREVFWEVPYDRSVGTSTQLGRPVVLAKPKAKVSQNLIDLVYTLSGTRQRVKAKGGWRRWLTRILVGNA